MGRIVNKRELAEIFGISERSFTEYQRAGLPFIVGDGRGHENQYDTGIVYTWLITRAKAGSTTESAKDRLDRLRGDREEIAIAKELGELAPAANFERVWTDHVLAARAELLNMSDGLATALSARYGINIDAQLICDAVEKSLARLSELNVDDFAESEDPEDDEPDGSADDWEE